MFVEEELKPKMLYRALKPKQMFVERQLKPEIFYRVLKFKKVRGGRAQAF